MPDQTILFTIMPRAVSVGGAKAPLPASVFVAPRLQGADQLGAFPDWVDWTQRVVHQGLRFQVATSAGDAWVAVDEGLLEPKLWEALFDRSTFVRSHQFDDYTGRPILSYSYRDTLAALKSLYKQAAVDLALPDAGPFERSTNRSRLERLVNGLQVRWDDATGESLRARYRDQSPSGNWVPRDLDAEGVTRNPPTNASVAKPFAVFHHMPTPAYATPLGEGWESKLDFHQALASLNAYPALQRALGLVFDIELPPGLVARTPTDTPDLISIEAVDPGQDWATPTTVPRLETAYLRTGVGARASFLAAPRRLNPTDADAPIRVVGLLDLDPARFGVAQVDVDGGMHKAIMLAETTTPDPDVPRNLNDGNPAPAANPTVFDPAATVASLRSVGITLYADGRAQMLLDTIKRSKAFNDALDGDASEPFYAEDLVRGYRLDIWDSHTSAWHSLHLRTEDYEVGGEPFQPGVGEGFVQLATTQQAPGAEPDADDLYLHEAVARWPGWSLSAPMPGKHLSRYPDAERAVPPDGNDPAYAENEPLTPFNVATTFTVVPGSLPLLRFGTRYRVRVRAVDLAGNSFPLDDPAADALSAQLALPQDPGGMPYLRFEPIPAPLIVVRDEAALTGPGSDAHRLVMRTFNDSPDHDAIPADTTASDRHLLPPRTSVELGERLGMFDDAAGKPVADAAMWQLIADRDAGELPSDQLVVAGKPASMPLVSADTVEPLPYLPDPHAQGVALRDLPGTADATLARAGTGSGPLSYSRLDDPHARPGSATLVPFRNATDWQKTTGIRLAISEPGPTPLTPAWDPGSQVLSVYLAKGETAVVPVSSFVSTEDLRLLGQWQWLGEQLAETAKDAPEHEWLMPGQLVDRFAQVIQRVLEGGHWLLTPPTLLTLVHALQQPLGRPEFTALAADDPDLYAPIVSDLLTAPSTGRTDPAELAPIQAYRTLGSTDAYLIGALRIHSAGTAQIDLLATWTDPDDTDLVDHAAHADQLPLQSLAEGYLTAPSGNDQRTVGYHDPEHDQIAFVRGGEWAGRRDSQGLTFNTDAAPRHALGDTKHHRISYTAVATSRFAEYFPPDQPGGFTRTSDPIVVEVPASAPPLAPDLLYVVPTFGWQRQQGTNLMRSVRFGGGLRIYLRRPWFSSGDGELVGVTLWSNRIPIDDDNRERLKGYVTQWGMDPSWQTASLSDVPETWSFPNAIASDVDLPLVDGTSVVNVVGFEPQFDQTRGLWFADVTVDAGETYMPFIRLALVRYQPYALVGAQLSRVVLADFAQLTPDRIATVTFDPYNPRVLNVAVSGVTPTGPDLQVPQIDVRVQQRDPALAGDVAWVDVDPAHVSIALTTPAGGGSDPTLWTGTITFAADPGAGTHRLLVTEYENLLTYDDQPSPGGPRRLVYAEAFLLGGPVTETGADTTGAPIGAAPPTASVVVLADPAATQAQLAALRSAIRDGGGTLRICLGVNGAVVIGDDPLFNTIRALVGDGVAAVVAAVADVPAGLDDETLDLVNGWLASQEPAYLNELADPARYGQSWGTLEQPDAETEL